MKKFPYLLTIICCIILAACEKPDVPTPPDPPTPPEDTTVTPGLSYWEVLDTTYTIRDYTVPSHTAFKIALTTCAADSNDANMAALQQRIKELVPKEEPYCMVATINGDPKTHMGFC